MKKYKSYYLAIFLLSAINSLQANLPVILKQERPVEGFDMVRLSGRGEVIITQGNEEKLVVEAWETVLPYIVSEVNGRRLELGMKKYRASKFTGKITYYLTMKNIAGIQVSGSGKITANIIESEEIDICISGSGDIFINNLNCADITASISGSGFCKITGEAQNQDVDISGSGEYEASKLNCDVAEIDVSGSGEAVIWVEKNLEVSISGSGKVGYYAQPAISSWSSGSGRMRHLGYH